MYMHDIETRFNRPERNADNIEAQPFSSISVFHQRARLFEKLKSIMLTQDEREKVRWYILNNTEKLQPYLEYHTLQSGLKIRLETNMQKMIQLSLMTCMFWQTNLIFLFTHILVVW